MNAASKLVTSIVMGGGLCQGRLSAANAAAALPLRPRSAPGVCCARAGRRRTADPNQRAVSRVRVRAWERRREGARAQRVGAGWACGGPGPGPWPGCRVWRPWLQAAALTRGGPALTGAGGVRAAVCGAACGRPGRRPAKAAPVQARPCAAHRVLLLQPHLQPELVLAWLRLVGALARQNGSFIISY